MRLISTQTQWAAGQGFFHSGSLIDEDADGRPVMTYVMDCGAVSAQGPVVREIKALNSHSRYGAGSRPLDVVFISHFDRDHISGIPLLHATSRPRRYVIPATDRLERLYLAARAKAQDVNEDLPDWYWDLLDDPSEFLGGLGGDPQIIEVLGGSGPDTGNEDPDGLYVDEQDTPFDGGAQRVFTHARRVRSGQNVAGVIDGPGRPGPRGPLPAWVWRTYVTSSVAPHLAKFEAVLSKTVPEYQSRKSAEGVVRWLVENHWAALCKAYDASGKIRNLSSLCVYSGPPPDSTLALGYWHGSRRSQPGPGLAGPGWLGAGDAGLDTDEEADAFVAAFRDVMPHVGTFAVPHHGARSSWNDLVLAGFKGVPAPTIVVGACPGFRGQEHPSREVIRAVSHLGSSIRVVTNAEASRWETETLVQFGWHVSWV